MVSKLLQNRPLFKECIESLEPNVTILSDQKSDQVWKIFREKLPFSQSGRIDWKKINIKKSIDEPAQAVIALESLLGKSINKSIYVLWNNNSVPVIKADFDSVIKHIDDVTCVGLDTWLFSPNGYVIEFYHLGEIMVGLFSGELE